MCPLCLATVAWIAAGTTSTGGISALAVKRFRGINRERSNNKFEKERSDGDQQGDFCKHEDTTRRIA
jgi:hypothetical protein